MKTLVIIFGISILFRILYTVDVEIPRSNNGYLIKTEYFEIKQIITK